jgi:hypothetical protein
MKRIALALAIAVAAIAATTFAAAGSAQGPATTSLHLTSTSQHAAGFAPAHDPPRAGDHFAIADKITGDDTGIDRVACTMTSKRQALCTAVVQLSKGTLTAQSLVNITAAQKRYAITGGTGNYDGASGTAIVKSIPNTPRADIQITLLP